MAAPRRKRLLRLLARLLGRDGDEVRALQNLRHLRGVLRFTVLFGVTVLIPILLVSYFALSSIRAEEALVEADMEHSVEAAASTVYQDLASLFGRFEAMTADRLRRGQSPLGNLSELSPHLRAVFRFDGSGQLVAPFTLPSPESATTPSPRFRELMRAGRTAERAGDIDTALDHYDRALAESVDPVLSGEAEYARARATWRAGQEREAERAFADIYANYANVRDRLGFRIGDLATLKRAEIALEREPDVGRVALEGLAEELLSARWTIGRPGEAAVTKRALAALDGRSDPDWLGRIRTRLDERTEQLYWAGALLDELELFTGPTLRVNPGEFRYYTRPESGSLWSTLWYDDSLYAFSFDTHAVHGQLQQALRRANDLDPEIVTRVVDSERRDPIAGSSRRSLSPWMPALDVVAAPASPETLATRKTHKRRRRVLIILLAVGTAVVGVVFSARLVGNELETARMKTDFAANVSHELRSPITQIRLKGEALQLDLVFGDDDRQAHYDAIVREAERLSRLVDNVLDFAAIERGAKRYTFRPDDLGEIVRNAVEAGRGYAESKGVTLEVDVPYDLPVVWCDREAVSQVFTNLLSNAVKYGRDGGWVGVRAGVGPDGVEVEVADRGIGIAPEDLDQIFEHFFRSADPKVRRRKGTGIGLTIVRYIVEEHGGHITVDSAPGQGTTFTAVFPLEPPEGEGA